MTPRTGLGTLRTSAQKRSRRARVASLTIVALAATSLGVAAANSRGSVVHEADLGDGGVWLTSDALAKYGRLNFQAGQMDAGVSADVEPGSAIDILQDGAAVLAWSKVTSQLEAIDPKTTTTNQATAVVPTQAAPPAGVIAGTVADLRGGTVALVEEKTGKVWAQRVDPRAGISDLSKLAAGSKPLATVGANAALAVGEDGAVHVVSGGESTVTTLTPTDEGFAKPVTTSMSAKGSNLQITALGKNWVVFDPAKDRIHTLATPDGGDAGLSTDKDHPAYAVLQVPGPEANAVAIAGATAVRMVELKGGQAPGGVEIQERVNRSATPPIITPPVVLKGCVHGAWKETNQVFYGANCGVGSPVPTGTIQNISEVAVRSGVKFRVNRGVIVLNDLDTGSAWDVDNNQQKLDNWDALIPPPEKQNENDKKDKNLVDDAVMEQPPTAMPDNLRVRAGRTSKLHVLDNDTDTSGSVLAIDPKDVSPASIETIRPSVAGDGQTIDVAVPAGATGAFTFTYLVGNGKAKSAAATVTVTIVDEQTNTAPRLREGATKLAATAYPVLGGHRISLPVVGDWRDGESDTVSISTADATLGVDGQGRVEFLAGLEPGVVSVPYLVSDGRGDPATGSVDVEVVGPMDTRPRNPITQPDVVRGVVGKPLQIEPLGNDIPGADPGDPEASMRLAGDVRAVGSLTVDTNRDTGVVTVTPAAAGTYVLSYAAQVGSGVAPGRIRVDVIADPDPAAPPIAVSDSATLRGQLSTMVDVLANDYSPRADVLVTQSVAVASDSDWVEASIYQGRWVRLRALEPAAGGDGASRPARVSYSVSDGTHVARGEIDVVQKQVTPITPVVRDDRAIVREGDAVTIPVLDNDTMADGIPLRLDPLSVKVLGDAPQTAFASDNVIRFVPQGTGLAGDANVTIEYAAYPEGDPQRAQTGRVAVTVTPQPSAARPNQAPVARSFTSSVTAGDPLTITVPTSGVDPDGDTVSIRGIVGRDGGPVTLKYGRIVSLGPDTIRYESYPTSSGTEVIDYEVTDRFGELSRAFVRVGVVAPGDPQPPVAVDDTVIAAPGKTVTIPVLQNDLVARGDSVTLSVNKGAGDAWRVDDETSMVSTKVPEETAPLHQTVYTIDNGIFDPSRATVLVRGRAAYINPPIAKDDVAKPEPGQETALVDVLANDFDIDSDPGTLKIARLLGPGGVIEQTPEGPKVRVTVQGYGYTIPYVAQDEDGAEGMALIHVPTGSKGRPYVPTTSLITMDKDSTITVPINDYVKSPKGLTLGITSATTLSSTPSGRLSVVADGSSGLTLTSSEGYVGPGAVTLEVTDQSTAEQEEVNTAYVTIPVQIGPKVPLLRCPTTSVQLFAGGLPRELDLPTLCRAWFPQGMSVEDVSFTASWSKEPSGVDLKQSGTGQRLVSLAAGTGAPSGEGLLSVGVQGGDTKGEVTVQVIGAPASGAVVEAPIPPPRLRPMAIAGLQEGQSQTVDVSSYLDSPLAKPECKVEAAVMSSGQNVTVSHSGCQVTVTAGKAPSLTATVSVTASDGPGRQAAGAIDVTLLGKPSAPQSVSAQPDREAGGRARVAWVAPTYDGGSPIRTYTVSWTGGSTGSLACTASPCTIEGLTNGKDYTFTVTATNAVGEGDASGASNVVRPDTKPGPVGGVTMTSRGDGSLTIAWQAPDNKGSAISKYTLRLIPTDGSAAARTVDVAAPALTTTVGGLNNEVQYSVSAQAWNEVGPGPFGAANVMQSAGTPPAVGAPTLSPGGLGANDDLTSVDIRWNATRPNGPPLTGYTVYKRVGGGGWSVLTKVSATTFTARDQVPVNGSRYDYVVTATNGANIESPQANASSFTAIGQPSTPTMTASTPSPDRTATLAVNLGNPHSTGYASVTWRSSAGGSGTICSGNCPSSGQVSVKTGALPTSNQTFTVTVNNGTHQATTTASAQPFGPTPTPVANGSSVSGQNVTFNWTLPTDGRPINRVVVSGDASYDGPPRTSITAGGNWNTNYGITVRAYTADAGASAGALSMSARTGMPPPNVNAGHGRTISNRPDQLCDTASPCYTLRVSISNFLSTATCTYYAAGRGGYPAVSGSLTVADGGTAETGGYWGYLSYPSTTVTCTSNNGNGQSKTVTVNWATG